MTPWVGRLLAANLLMFFVSHGSVPLRMAMTFIPGLALERPWTFITYLFLHGDFWHLFGNMLGLYFLGPRVESRLGGRRFLTLYFLSGIVGAALSIPLAPNAAIIGASGAVFGVMLGFARYWPHERLMLWGILPIEAWLLVVLTAIELFRARRERVAQDRRARADQAKRQATEERLRIAMARQ